MRRRTGPVQQWIDSIPLPTKSDVIVASECEEYMQSKPLTPTEPKDILLTKESRPPSMTVSAPINVPNSPAMNTPILPSSLPHRLARDASFQSDSSHCSSVESLLELRKADPTAILLDLGFGGCSTSPQENGPFSRIPKRFLQPSSLKGIAIDDFVKQQQQTSESFDSVSLGYRGLTGSPYVAPSEIVQKIMERLREHDSHEVDTSAYNHCEQYSPSHQNGRLSVLSPDNRQFLEQPRSKSPDMRNKRMIIGQKSFAFGCDGNLIEISANDVKHTSIDTVANCNATSNVDESIESKQSFSAERVTFEHSYFSDNDDNLAKQSSFDDTVVFPVPDLFKRDQASSSSNLDVAQSGAKIDCNEWEYNIAETPSRYGNYEFPRHCPDIRRSSEGACDTKVLEDKMFDEGRRFSDGAVHVADSRRNECTLLQKRKSLKRQSRVYDTMAMQYCDLSPIKSSVADAILESNVDSEEVSHDITDISIHQLNAPKSFQLTENKDDTELETEAESCLGSPSYASSPGESCESIDQIRHLKIMEEDSESSDHSCVKDAQVCYYKDKVCNSCKHGRNCLDCCCHVEKRKYLKKMEKIMQENKKLENMLARNRREVAEIRDILSNVWSVRMEPGF
ncbi:uncharacterized protein LOC105181887 isoform X2 [Harpegnathos saltator]|uniref:ITPR-interacting domain-containing protein n=2 Tax=Harpegnathos saltator TaxID=610380 RepID=E2BED5_HARSA|nr:uncharacterized protein LOC105181887 isoform X2 [Harpegnathos saltator]XP_025163259.1 uncharacterized protein LOC105181887 isoform X2 [Harpegnathos saltator]EFN85980.1 hypothetical protein EAI_07905 [Harpegnathos saltator]